MAAGNRFCGVRPSSNYNIYSCGMIRKECKRDGAIWPNCLTIPNSTIPAPPPSGLSHSSDSETLPASLDGFNVICIWEKHSMPFAQVCNPSSLNAGGLIHQQG